MVTEYKTCFLCHEAYPCSCIPQPRTQGNEAPSTSPQYKPAAAEPEAKLQHEEAARSPRMQGNHSPEGINLGRMLGEDEAHALDCSPLLKGAGAGRARSATEMQIRLGQTRAHSLLESLANIGIGFGVSVLANYLILPLYGMQASVRSSFEIGVWFTLISFARSYLLRRAFNWININTGRGSR